MTLTGVGLPGVTLISTILNIVIVLIMFIILMRHPRRRRDVFSLLLINTYFTPFVYSLVISFDNVDVFKADLYDFAGLTDGQLTLCRIQYFLFFVTLR